jgi:hypothetical protein
VPLVLFHVVFGVAAGVVRFVALPHPRPYFATYWITEAGFDVLGILVMYELLRMVLGSLARRWWGRLIFPAALVASIGMSLARAHTSPPQFSGLYYYIVVGEITVRYAQVLIFIELGALTALASLLGVRWRRYSLGVCIGFGLYSSVALIMTTKFWNSGIRFKFFWGRALIAAYSLAVLIWIGFFLTPEVENHPPTPAPVDSALDAPNKYPGRSRKMRQSWPFRLRLE